MTATGSPTLTASPADFDTYGHYSPPPGAFVEVDGETRIDYPFGGRITDDGSSGWPAEAGRYHLYVSLTCPWAQRPLIALKLRGLDRVVSWSSVDPVRDGRGWAFRDGPGYGPDPVNGFVFLRDAYLATDPTFAGHVSVPALWDRTKGRLVSNHYPTLTADLETRFERVAAGSPSLYPAGRRTEIDDLNERTTAHLLRPGADTASAHTTLSWYDHHLSGQRFLLGDSLSDADLLLYVALLRLDLVFADRSEDVRPHLADHPQLWAYARDLYQRPAFTETTSFDHLELARLARAGGPTGTATEGPSPADRRAEWSAPHDRDRLAGAAAVGE